MNTSRYSMNFSLIFQHFEKDFVRKCGLAVSNLGLCDLASFSYMLMKHVVLYQDVIKLQVFNKFSKQSYRLIELDKELIPTSLYPKFYRHHPCHCNKIQEIITFSFQLNFHDNIQHRYRWLFEKITAQ